MTPNAPAGLVEELQSRRLVLFVGAGLSVAAGMPTGRTLARVLHTKMAKARSSRTAPGDQAENLDVVADRYQEEYGRVRLARELESRLVTSDPGDIGRTHYLIALLIKHRFVDTIVTTNFDTLIEDACRTLGVPLRVIVEGTQLPLTTGEPALLKIHGDFSHPDLLVVTKRDYARFSSEIRRKVIWNHLASLLQTRPFLFLGYSLEDFNVLDLLYQETAELESGSRLKSYFGLRSGSDLDYQRGRLRDHNIEVLLIDDAEDLLSELLSRLSVRLNILHIVLTYPEWFPFSQSQYGGIETYVNLVADARASRHAHQVRRIWAKELGDYEGRYHSPSYPSSYFYFKFLTTAAIHGVIREHRLGSSLPDVVHVHFLAFALESQKAGLPTVCTSHSLLSKDLAFAQGLFDDEAVGGIARHDLAELLETERAACRRSKTIVTLSDAHAEELRALRAGQILRLPPPFDGRPFLSIPEEPDHSAIPYGCVPPLKDLLTVSFVGRPDRRKGLEVLIRACELLGELGEKFQLLLVGSFQLVWQWDSSPTELIFSNNRFSIDLRHLKEIGIGLHTYSPGNNPSGVALAYRASDIVVVPSLYEPLGYVVLEAMASARPVLGSRTGGIKELIKDEETGVLFEPGSASELAAKLKLLLGNPDLRRRLGKSGRETVQTVFDLQKAVSALDDLYERVAFGQPESSSPPPYAEDLEKIYREHLIGWAADANPAEITIGACRIYQKIRRLLQERRVTSGDGLHFEILEEIAERVHVELRKQGNVAIPANVVLEMMKALILAYLNKEEFAAAPVKLSAERTQQILSKLPPAWPSNLLTHTTR